MGFTMAPQGGHFVAAATCDRCGTRAGTGGFALWDLAREETGDHLGACVIACGDECAEWLTSPYDDPDADWIAIQLDAYLANLVTTLNIDVPTVLERERAESAAIYTRDESPD